MVQIHSPRPPLKGYPCLRPLNGAFLLSSVRTHPLLLLNSGGDRRLEAAADSSPAGRLKIQKRDFVSVIGPCDLNCRRLQRSQLPDC
jgi:hypothetical protein